MKRCPHCHADSFGARELLVLDYFSDDECKKCKKPVRNDGLRQFLMIPAILTALCVGFFIMSLIPEVLEPFALLFTFLLVISAMIVVPKPVRAEYKVSWSQFDPDLENDKVIMVNGWNEAELRRVLEEFAAENPSGSPPYRVELHQQHGNTFRLTFPEDIHPSLFASLVNYLMYPTEFGIPARSVIVAGQTTLNSAFEGIPKSLLGQKAVLYVPENDTDYDLVYLETEAGANFTNSLDGEAWHRAGKARMSGKVKRLALSE